MFVYIKFFMFSLWNNVLPPHGSKSFYPHGKFLKIYTFKFTFLNKFKTVFISKKNLLNKFYSYISLNLTNYSLILQISNYEDHVVDTP